jgi:hypothetical protein
MYCLISEKNISTTGMVILECTASLVDRTLSSGGISTLDAFAAGTQYLILDAGGFSGYSSLFHQ